MKTLYLIRHAKSAQSLENISDFDRPLNERGLKDAPKMAEKLSQKMENPNLIMSSPAHRALSTAIFFADAFNYPQENIKKEERIYEAGVQTLLKVINEVDNQYNTVMMFGHNPGFTNLFNYLTDNDLSNLPTCGIVKIEFEFDNWNLISGNTGVPTYIDYPKNKD